MTLYDLTNEWAMLMAMAEDPEMDPQLFQDTLEGLDGDLEQKSDNYARVMKSLEHDAAALRAEEKRLADRRRTIENNLERMKKSLEQMMRVTGKMKFKTPFFTFGIQKNPARLVIDDLAAVPDRYLIPQDPKVDAVKVKELLKDLGVAVPWAHMEQGESLRIR